MSRLERVEVAAEGDQVAAVGAEHRVDERRALRRPSSLEAGAIERVLEEARGLLLLFLEVGALDVRRHVSDDDQEAPGGSQLSIGS